jgi:hypothetical protein
VASKTTPPSQAPSSSAPASQSNAPALEPVSLAW